MCREYRDAFARRSESKSMSYQDFSLTDAIPLVTYSLVISINVTPKWLLLSHHPDVHHDGELASSLISISPSPTIIPVALQHKYNVIFHIVFLPILTSPAMLLGRQDATYDTPPLRPCWIRFALLY